MLKQLGSRGVLRSGTTGLQVVLGPVADQVAGEIRAALRSGAGDSGAADSGGGVPVPEVSMRQRCSRHWVAAAT